jgi:hypothetical protein
MAAGGPSSEQLAPEDRQHLCTELSPQISMYALMGANRPRTVSKPGAVDWINVSAPL